MSKIVAGVDGSEVARRALAWARQQARVVGLPLEVVHVYESRRGAAHLLSVHEEDVPEANVGVLEQATKQQRQAAAERAHAAIEAMLTDVSPREDIRPVVIDDQHPARALVDAAADAELLVVGSRGRGGFAGLVLGSVSQQCAHHATCPVVIVPPKGTER